MFAKKLGVDDLCMIGNETNEEITKQLEARLKAEAIYTNIGDVLISVNPFKQLGIYGSDYVQIYSSATTYDNSPHIYALAQNAYSNMMADDSSQAVIISGESGAGKTEAAKLILNYISAVSPGSEASARMKSNIESTNPLLESFGNAKTVRNDNSSRFGKYLEVAFNSSGEPSSGQTLKFLLEKTRVAFQAKGERNFHIFYQLVTGCSDEMREAFGLGGVNDYFYLSQSGVTTVTGVNDSQMFQEVLHAMKVVGISDTDQWRCFQCLAAILHIGNITLEGDPKARVTNADELKWAAYLLSVEEARLEHCIMTRLMASPRGSMYEIPQNAVQATGMRDALAKTLYERVFSWLVECINQAMGGASQQQARAPPPNPMGGGRGGAPPPRGRGGFGTSATPAAAQPVNTGINLGSRTIGVLDIYGFEIFEQNGYEQFCINYVNERLQQIFIDLTLKQEQKEYHEEEMKWKDIQFFDNKIVVELIEGKNPPGIFRVLDDVCRTAHAVDSQVADAKFMEKLGKTITSHPHLIMDSQKFTIKHYAGDVTYTIEDFCFKNKDNLFLSIVVGMQTTQEPWIQTLFADADAKQGPPTTSGGDLRNSANQLINRLAQCTGHYVRTIKPNETRSPLTFVYDRVKHQVKYLGLLENVKVKKSGYSYRHYFHNFVERFGRLCAQPPSDSGISGVQQVIAAVTSQPFQNITISRDEFGLGKTKIFVKSPETIFQMSEMLEAKLDPEGYKLKMQEFKKVEKVAMKQKAKTEGLKRKCLIM